MDSCKHETILQQLTELEESEQFATLLEIAWPIAVDLEARGDLDSIRVSLQIRFVIMKALALTGRPEEAISLWEETQEKYGSHKDEEIVFWVYSAAVACADSHWQLGNHDETVGILEYCIERFSSHPHPALRGLGVRANVDLSLCRFEEGDKEFAVSQVTQIIQRYEDDLAVTVNEELSRASRFLCEMNR